jgi:hypothetical protein
MPRYIIERTFPDKLNIPEGPSGANACLNVVNNNSIDDVTWIYSYVTKDKKKSFCVYDAPSPEAIRKVAKRNQLPVDKITEVTVLEPYHYF